jgi:hypothetical protein
MPWFVLTLDYILTTNVLLLMLKQDNGIISSKQQASLVFTFVFNMHHIHCQK